MVFKTFRSPSAPVSIDVAVNSSLRMSAPASVGLFGRSSQREKSHVSGSQHRSELSWTSCSQNLNLSEVQDLVVGNPNNLASTSATVDRVASDSLPPFNSTTKLVIHVYLGSVDALYAAEVPPVVDDDSVDREHSLQINPPVVLPTVSVDAGSSAPPAVSIAVHRSLRPSTVCDGGHVRRFLVGEETYSLDTSCSTEHLNLRHVEVVVSQGYLDRPAGGSVTRNVVDVSAWNVEDSSATIVGDVHFGTVNPVLAAVHSVVDHDKVDVVVVFQVNLPPHVSVGSCVGDRSEIYSWLKCCYSIV